MGVVLPAADSFCERGMFGLIGTAGAPRGRVAFAGWLVAVCQVGVYKEINK